MEGEREGMNILVTGTPGCGKTSTCKALASKCGFNHVNVSELVLAKELHEGRNEEFDTMILDEDKLCDEMEPIMQKGSNIVDFHSCEMFPERWFDLIIVLRTDNSILYERLEKRGYAENKIQENIEAEIMQVCLDEANEFYDPEIVHEMESNTTEQMESNVERLYHWIMQQREEDE